MTDKLSGRCLCGEITFEVEPPLRDILICHCTQCAQWSGHQVAATGVPPERFDLTAGSNLLKWYRSSDDAERGFCSNCGSSLFWRPEANDRIAIMAGTMDDPSGLKVGSHIFTADQRNYIKTDDAAPRFEDAGPMPPARTGE